MEPVPETERLEDFKSAPRPSLRLQSPTTPTRLPRSSFGPMSPLELDHQQQPLKRPFNLRRSTDPIPLSPKSPSSFGLGVGKSSSTVAATSLAYRPRTTSPLTLSNQQRSRVPMSHGRSKSHIGLSMSRAQSLPGVNGAGHLLYSPSSPTSSPQRTRTPKKNPDDMFPTSPVRTSVLESSPRFNRNRSTSPVSYSVTPFPLMDPALASAPVPIPVSTQPSANAAYSSSPLAPSPLAATPQITMMRVRPASPLRNPPPAASSATASLLSSPVSLGRPTAPTANNSSSPDSLYSTNYSNLSISSLASSSIPSTPTSARSRSPSVSSLETIPDSPDAEEAAVEADRISQLKAAAEAAAKGGNAADQKPTKESRGSRGFRDKRKRWSVCGAERRGDLDLETIWED
ncbi:uncharacterized protein BROUX77_001976 [Berkeleyomyces rouxiae]|uniref:uncharacterized protein n=1 Tax=Berkeleyomyces rouxiae TaxID=2035830 RepID=UPI003B7FA12D